MVSIFSNLIPMREPLETAELLAFSKTVDAKSLSRAAAELGVPRATISRRLQRLEEQLGVRLLRRTTRRLVLTDAGEAFYRQARLVLEAVENAEASVTRPDGALRGELRISVPPFQIESFYALLTEFADRHPEVRVHAHFGSQYVDLVRGGYDVALRASRALEPGLVARTLMRFPQIAVASPSYLERFGTPKTLSDLRKHRCLAGFDRGELPQTHWPLADGGRHAIEPWLSSNDLNLLLVAAERGLGIAFLPLMTIRTAMEGGKLLHVLPGILEAHTGVAVVYPEREFMPPQVRAFADLMASWAKEEFQKGMPECPAQPPRPVLRRKAKKKGRRARR
jgi:DNA-binding transcriptional LysR family regulator